MLHSFGIGEPEPGDGTSPRHAGCGVPDPMTGALVIEPEFSFGAPNLGVQIAFFYNGLSALAGVCGPRRSSSLDARVSLAEGAFVPRAIRGDGTIRQFRNGVRDVKGIRFAADEPGCFLLRDGTGFAEGFTDGAVLRYERRSEPDPRCFLLTSMKLPCGLRFDLSYGKGPEADLVKTVQVQDGRVLEFTHVQAGCGHRLSSALDWNRRPWSFAYDFRGNLVAITSPAGRVTSYEYDGVGRIVSAERSAKVRTQYAYDSAGRLRSAAIGEDVWAWEYGSARGPLTRSVMTCPSGRKTVIQAGKPGRGLSARGSDGITRTSSLGPGGSGFLAVRTASDAVTDALMSDKRFAGCLEPGEHVHYQYDRLGRCSERHGSRGLLSRFEYDGSNNLVGATDGGGHTTLFRYDALGRVTSKAEPTGKITTFRYDEDDRLI